MTVTHEMSGPSGLAITEEQDLVYRAAVEAGTTETHRQAPRVEDEPAWSRTIVLDTVLLFRYSALTFNAHRIHYDLPYTRDVEGYPALVMNGGLTALLLTHTNFSVSSGVGFLALFGVSVQTGVILLEYINQLRARGLDVLEAAIEGSVQRLRPITMTMLVASLGLLPAALSRGIGSDSQSRDRDCGRAGSGADSRGLFAADALRVGRGSARCTACTGRAPGGIASGCRLATRRRAAGGPPHLVNRVPE